MDTAGVKLKADMFDGTEEYDEEEVFDFLKTLKKNGNSCL